MRVLFLSFAFGEYSVLLAGALSHIVDVCLMLPEREAAPYMHKLQSRVTFLPFERPRMRELWRQPALLYSLHGKITSAKPDLIHLQQGYLWFNVALPFFRQYPLVLTIHDPRHHVGDMESQKTPQWVMDYGFQKADGIIVHTPQMKQQVVESCGIEERAVYVVPTVERGDRPKCIIEEAEDPEILFFGRIWEYKGLEYLIRAEPLITARIPNAKIVIAGTGEDLTRYVRMMINPGHFVVKNEFIPPEQVPEIFQRACIVVLPYVEATQSGVVATAYTYGKPVVATTVGGLPDQVEHGQTGLLVPPRDERALADAIVTLLEDKELRLQLGAGGRRKSADEYAADVVARRTLKVYQAILNRASSQGDPQP